MKGMHATATAEKVMIEDAKADASVVFDDGLPPPTHAQIEYWRKLCGALSLVKGTGMADEAWPTDLAPTKPTLTALVERRIIVRRRRAWHLKRGWYGRHRRAAGACRADAAGILRRAAAADLPSYAEIEGFERICRWLDANRSGGRDCLSSALIEQLGAESEVPIVLLHLMRKYRLARHTSTCEWALSPTWKDRLRALWDGVDREVREQFPRATNPVGSERGGRRHRHGVPQPPRPRRVAARAAP